MSQPNTSAQRVQDGRWTAIPNELHDLAETPREFQLMAALLSFRWYPTSPIIPSVETLASMLACSRRTVRRTVAALEARGYIRRIERRAADDRQLSNDYALCGPLLALVTTIEAARVRDVGQQWQGRRSPWPTKRDSGKQTPSTRRIERVNTDPAAFTSGELGRWIRT